MKIFLLHNDPAREQSGGLEHELTVGILGLLLDLLVVKRDFNL